MYLSPLQSLKAIEDAIKANIERTSPVGLDKNTTFDHYWKPHFTIIRAALEEQKKEGSVKHL
jgi:hypothetical protein